MIYPVIGDLGNLVVDELRHNQSEVGEFFLLSAHLVIVSEMKEQWVH